MPGINSFLSLLFLLIFFGAVLFLAYVSTKFIGGKASGGMRGRYLKVIDSISFGFDRQIYLMKIGEQLILVSSSNKSIQFLTVLDNNLVKITEDDAKLFADGHSAGVENLFKNYLDKFKNVGKKNIDSSSESTIDNEANRFKQNLSKLKNIFSKINSEKNGDEKPDE